jgi:methylated-DNA-protein-cysteine methyltransferase-like protein
MIGFYNKVYDVVKRIPRGKVTTYGKIAAMIGAPGSAKIVGWALHSNPDPGTIPCHRVVNRNGETSGSFAFGGPDVQKQLLESEGVIFSPEGNVDLGKCLWIEDYEEF